MRQKMPIQRRKTNSVATPSTPPACALRAQRMANRFMLSTWKIAPALAAGCTVVHKPAEWSPLTARLLIEIAEKYGQRNADGIELCVKLSHQEMASIIGSTRETVTVMLGQLQNEGIIQVNRRRITITDLQKLSAEVSEPVTGIETKFGTGQHEHRPHFDRVKSIQGVDRQ